MDKVCTGYKLVSEDLCSYWMHSQIAQVQYIENQWVSEVSKMPLFVWHTNEDVGNWFGLNTPYRVFEVEYIPYSIQGIGLADPFHVTYDELVTYWRKQRNARVLIFNYSGTNTVLASKVKLLKEVRRF